jgi:hypothetical protein
MLRLTTPRPSKIFPNWDFWYARYGNPGLSKGVEKFRTL